MASRRYYVMSKEGNIVTGKLPEYKAFSSGQKARAYAVLRVMRTGEKQSVYDGTGPRSRIIYVIRKTKNGFRLDDMQMPFEFGKSTVNVFKDGTVGIPDYETEKPYWGAKKQKSAKYTYTIEPLNFDATKVLKSKTMKAANIDEVRARLSKVLTERGMQVYILRQTKNGSRLVGSLKRNGDLYWTGYSYLKGWYNSGTVGVSGRVY